MKAWRKSKLVIPYGTDEDGNMLYLVGRKAKNFIQFLPKVNTQLPKITLALLNRAGVFNEKQIQQT